MFSSPAILVGSLLFGAIGFGAFMYGKKMVLYKPMVIGFVLMAYPYFVPQTWLMSHRRVQPFCLEQLCEALDAPLPC
jgi:hypothetical protein